MKVDLIYSVPICLDMYGGIDLAAKVDNETGVSVLSEEDQVESDTVFADKDIIKWMEECSVIAIDAPLTITENLLERAKGS